MNACFNGDILGFLFGHCNDVCGAKLEGSKALWEVLMSCRSGVLLIFYSNFTWAVSVGFFFSRTGVVFLHER